MCAQISEVFISQSVSTSLIEIQSSYTSCVYAREKQVEIRSTLLGFIDINANKFEQHYIIKTKYGSAIPFIYKFYSLQDYHIKTASA